MRRILLVLSVAALVAALMVASALPAFAARQCSVEDGTSVCRGGSGEQGGGSGGYSTVDPESGLFSSGGGGSGAGGPDVQQGGGSGGHNTMDFNTFCITESGGSGIGGKGYMDVGEQPGGSGGHIANENCT